MRFASGSIAYFQKNNVDHTILFHSSLTPLVFTSTCAYGLLACAHLT